MAKHETPHLQHNLASPATAPQATAPKHPWQEPKLTFVEPKLIIHGELQEITGQFFGGFSPHPSPHN